MIDTTTLQLMSEVKGICEISSICEASSEIINALVPPAQALLNAGLEPDDICDLLCMAASRLEKQKATKHGLHLV